MTGRDRNGPSRRHNVVEMPRRRTVQPSPIAGASPLGRPELLAMAGVAGLAAALSWSLLHFGSTRDEDLYGLFLLLLLPLGLAVASLVRKGGATRPVLAVGIVGTALAILVAARPTFLALGYTHLWVGICAVLVGLSAAVAGRRAVALLFALVILIGVGEIAYGLLQATGRVDTILGVRMRSGGAPSGTLINPNHFAGLVNMTIMLVGGLLVGMLPSARRDPLERLALGFFLVSIGAGGLLALAYTGSRGGVLSLAGGLTIVCGLLAYSRDHRYRRRFLATVVVLAVVAGVALFVGLQGRPEVVEDLSSPGGSVERLAIYGDSLRLIADHPLLGVSPGLWQWRFRRYQSVTSLSYYEHAHNDYLETAAEWGVPLAALVWGLVYLLTFRSGRLLAVLPRGSGHGHVTGAVGAVTVLLLHGFVDFNLQTPSNLVFFAVLVGFLWGTCSEAGPTRGPALGVPHWLPALLAIAFLAASCVAGWRVQNRRTVAIAVAGPAGIEDIGAILARGPDNPELALMAGLNLRDGLGRHDTHEARVHLERAVRLNPYSWRYRLELARLDELDGRGAVARAGVAEAVRLNPHSGEYRWRLANLDLRLGATDAAIDGLGEAVARDHRLDEAAIRLALKAGSTLQELDARWPNDAAVRLGLIEFACRTPDAISAAPGLVASSWARIAPSMDGVSYRSAGIVPLCQARLGRPEEARRTWIEIARAVGERDREFESMENLLWNGSFERPFARGGLGWITSSRGEVRVARQETREGRTTLRIELAGVGRPLILVHAAVPAPLVELELSAMVRRFSGVADGEMVLEFVALPGGEILASLPLDELDSAWRELGGRVRLPNGTGALVGLRLRRSAGSSGTVRSAVLLFDSVRLAGAD